MTRLTKLVLVGLMVPFTYAVLGIAIWRMPIGSKQVLRKEVRWKFLDLVPPDPVRGYVWEAMPWGSSTLYLADGGHLYVSERDLDLVWSISPFELEKRGRTKIATLSMYPVLAGGFTPARIERLEEVPGTPILDK
jgi:hypothetical protein